ncbi:SpvB/TcaC N-terminal domain-containing protein, partial [Pseudoteredinibacter isoporae]|uniref:SpvB/TcaC N-terminal domain-containing protein n=1 Tax=Pseudoteredinibacter isoporae TaxID=570281 RepID=UPI00333E64F3
MVSRALHSLSASALSLLFSCFFFSASIQAAQTATPPGLSLPSITLESNLGGVYRGELPGQARVDHLGAAVYEVPLEIPEHIGALRPNLSIYYNSNSNDGLLGRGWTIRGLEDTIERCPMTKLHDGQVGSVRYDSNDRFCLNGQRLIAVQGAYGANGTEYRTENDRFARITSIGQKGSGPASFKVETKSGLVKHYGTETAKYLTFDQNNVVTWALSTVEDRLGNMYKYMYESISSGFQVRQIAFGHNGVVSSRQTIEFTFGGRAQRNYQGGFYKMAAPRFITSIKSHVDFRRISYYEFEYDAATIQTIPQLKTIQKCGESGCPSRLNVEWAGKSILAASSQTLDVPYEPFKPTGPNYCPKVMQKYPRWHDFDGDGRLDYLFLEPQSSFSFNAASVLNTKLWVSSRNAIETWPSDAANDVEKLVFGDINNDGKTDIVNIDKGVSGKIEVSLSTGTAFSTQHWGLAPIDRTVTSWQSQSYTQAAHDIDYSLRDMNNDGRADLVTMFTYSTSKPYGSNTVTYYWVDVYVSLNTGTEFSTEVKWASGVAGAADSGTSWTDVNNDGLVDLIGVDHKFFINDSTQLTGEMWANNNNTSYPVSPGAGRARFMDVNRDGLPDRLLYTNVNGQLGWFVRHNNGIGFETYDGFFSSSSSGFIPDMNGDGFLDTSTFTVNGPIHVHGGNSVINLSSSSYVASGSVSAHAPPSEPYASGSFNMLSGLPSGFNSQGHKFHREFLDFNNDGKLDSVISLASICHNAYQSSYPTAQFAEKGKMLLQINSTVDANKVSKITNGLGAYSQFTYDSIANSSVHIASSGAALPVKDVTGGRTVVHTLKQPNGIGGEWTKTYNYQGRKLSIDGRGDLGFEQITVSNSQTGIATKTSYSQTFPTIGRPIEIEKQHIASTRRLSRTQYTYATQGTIGSGPVFPYVSSSTSQKYDPEDGRLLSTRIINNTFDTYGNVTQSTTELNDHETGVTFNTQKQRNFTVNASTWRLAQLDQEKVQFGQSGAYDTALTRTTSFDYYANGLVHHRYQEPNAGAPLELTQRFEYNNKGRPTKSEISGPGITARASTTAYGSLGLLPSSTQNALGHQTTYQWKKSGQLIQQVDPNGLTVTNSYDSSGVLKTSTLPGNNTVQHSLRLDSTGQNNGAKYYTEVVPAGKPTVRTFYDMLGRPVRVRTQSFDGRYVNQDTQYDAHGRPYRVSEPYFDGGPRVWNTTQYDAYHRISSVDAADNVSDTTFDYDGFEAGVKDNANRRQVAKTNANGWLIESVDKAGTKTDFSYNAAGQRTRVRSAVGLSKQFSVLYQYDRLGRMTQQDDPSHGVYSYKYNALGQRVKEISPKMWAASQSVQFAYDLLGRMTHRYEPEGTTTWEYDNTANGNMGLGKLHRESMTGFSRQYAYAAGQFGRLTSTTTQIQSVSYTEGMSYDSEGNLETITYPVTPGS